MLIIPFVLVIILLSYYFGEKLKKYNLYFYIFAAILGVLALIFSAKQFTLPFNQGFLGFSFFYVVMIIGLLNKESKIYKRLFKVRPELSILGFILLSPHAIFYLMERIMTNYIPDTRIVSLSFLIGVLAYLIMIPLFVTSFKIIENKAQFFKWKKLQRFAYIVYLAIFIHLIFVAEMPNLVIYLILFIPYIIFKPIRFFKYEKPMYKKMMKDAGSKKNN
jgi:DMSO/TMAO reductase YedYZ heme-binding membrane subunit